MTKLNCFYFEKRSKTAQNVAVPPQYGDFLMWVSYKEKPLLKLCTHATDNL